MNILYIMILIFSYANFSLTIPKYYSQFGQDEFIHKAFFKNKRNGIFFEIGAYDGILSSNTYFFEKTLNWKGVCVEPINILYNKLIKNRKCICINGCVWHKTGPAKFFKFVKPDGFILGQSGLVDSYDLRQLKKMKEDCKKKQCILQLLDVQCFKFNDICKKNNLFHIDYLSIDTEGSELLILKSIDWKNIDISIISVEDNYNDQIIRNFLINQGYRFVVRLSVDDIYQKIRNNLK